MEKQYSFAIGLQRHFRFMFPTGSSITIFLGALSALFKIAEYVDVLSRIADFSAFLASSKNWDIHTSWWPDSWPSVLI